MPRAKWASQGNSKITDAPETAKCNPLSTSNPLGGQIERERRLSAAGFDRVLSFPRKTVHKSEQSETSSLCQGDRRGKVNGRSLLKDDC